MTTRTTTVGQEKQGFKGVLAMTAATAALLGGVVLFQLRPIDDAAAPTPAVTIGHVSDGAVPMGGLAELYRDEQRAAAQTTTALPRGGMAELYAEQQAAAGTSSFTSVSVDALGGMAELYRDQRAAADQDRTRLACGEGVQPAICY